ncbi:MAG: hypothetical protein L6Q71_12500 [Planctomycetes bacterium]|nr:hypothetical protein [Planctomycetota bacterium]NUQ34698.1 hypothetical protein [Planctomycetaceae bacterium]
MTREVYILGGVLCLIALIGGFLMLRELFRRKRLWFCGEGGEYAALRDDRELALRELKDVEERGHVSPEARERALSRARAATKALDEYAQRMKDVRAKIETELGVGKSAP